MGDELVFDGKKYITVRRASEISGYTRDYIGQLARSGKIEARRLERAWFVSEDSLLRHKDEADQYIPMPPVFERKEPEIRESFVGLDGKEYISAKRASHITGYNQDYVSQLAREGKIHSQQVAGRWYVIREEIVNHKKESDALLARVQAEASGFFRQKHTENVLGERKRPELLAYVREEVQENVPLQNSLKLKTVENTTKEDNTDAFQHKNVVDLRNVTLKEPKAPSTVRRFVLSTGSKESNQTRQPALLLPSPRGILALLAALVLGVCIGVTGHLASGGLHRDISTEDESSLGMAAKIFDSILTEESHFGR